MILFYILNKGGSKDIKVVKDVDALIKVLLAYRVLNLLESVPKTGILVQVIYEG